MNDEMAYSDKNDRVLLTRKSFSVHVFGIYLIYYSNIIKNIKLQLFIFIHPKLLKNLKFKSPSHSQISRNYI